MAAGGVIYRANCQACHTASGSGGALSYGRAAPDLSEATPEQVAAAVRSGPGQMPVFGTTELGDRELERRRRLRQYLEDPEDPGGFPIGRIGPIPEGFVAWLFGIGGPGRPRGLDRHPQPDQRGGRRSDRPTGREPSLRSRWPRRAS